MRALLEGFFAKEDFLFLGSTLPSTFSDFQKYESWLLEKRHGEMVYLEQNNEARKNADHILPGARSVLVFALPYFHDDPKDSFRYALYSHFRDYHKVLKERGERLIERLKDEFPGEYRVTVDTAPVLERALAAKTVDGFIGKNTCYIHPKYGSFLLLGEIFSTAVFPDDEPSHQTGCGTCTLCQIECPTGALDDDYRIDARKCLAYWTIENRGTIPFEFWPHLEKYVFGCDLCQSVCPYNASAVGALPKSLSIRSFPPLYEVATMTQAKYELAFGGTAVTRARREGLRRNALIAMAFSEHPLLSEALTSIDSDPHPVLVETRAQIERYLQNCRENRVDLLNGNDKFDTFSVVPQA